MAGPFLALPLLLKLAIAKGAAFGAWKAIQSNKEIVDSGSDLKTEIRKTLRGEPENEDSATDQDPPQPQS